MLRYLFIHFGGLERKPESQRLAWKVAREQILASQACEDGRVLIYPSIHVGGPTRTAHGVNPYI